MVVSGLNVGPGLKVGSVRVRVRVRVSWPPRVRVRVRAGVRVRVRVRASWPPRDSEMVLLPESTDSTSSLT